MRIGDRAAAPLAAAGLLFLAVALWIAGSKRPDLTVYSDRFGSVSALTFDGRSLWITQDGKPVIYEVDPDSAAVRRQVEFVTGDTGGSAWDGEALWQLAYLERRLYRIDTSTGRITGWVPSPGKGLCAGVTFDGKYLWVANFDDGRLYQIDQTNQGRVVRTVAGNFETTGLAWDGRYLWSGILVGTKEHGERTPYTAFVQQQDLDTGETLGAIPVPGVGPGGAEWVPGAGRAKRFWWYDGYHDRIMTVRVPATVNVMAMPAMLAGFVCALAAGQLRRRALVAVRQENTDATAR